MITQRQTDIDRETFSVSFPETGGWTNILPDYINIKWGQEKQQPQQQEPQTAGLQTNTLLIVGAIAVIGIMFMMKK